MQAAKSGDRISATLRKAIRCFIPMTSEIQTGVVHQAKPGPAEGDDTRVMVLETRAGGAGAPGPEVAAGVTRHTLTSAAIQAAQTRARGKPFGGSDDSQRARAERVSSSSCLIAGRLPKTHRNRASRARRWG